jgi:hypothetical protein
MYLRAVCMEAMQTNLHAFLNFEQDTQLNFGSFTCPEIAQGAIL